VLGLIFEKINGYKDGSFFTPGFITMYMCRETIRKAVVQKFNESKKWHCTSLEDLYDKIEDRKEANNIVNSIKICDPAVGSGHFLVSALNEMIAVKNDLKILQDRNEKRLKEYQVEVVNDELIVTDEEGELFEYNPGNKESQRIQETLFHEKQTIIENCLFGVDINSNSVKICRLRLWIELLKNAYYKNTTELETLPNIDINIKCGNSLVSRFAIDADLKQALKKSKWTIESYRLAVDTYRNAQNKEQKREMEKLIATIKTDFRSEISQNDPKVKKLSIKRGELFNLTQTKELFDSNDKKTKDWNKKVKALAVEVNALENDIEEIKANKIFDNAFEWRFEFPEVLNDDGDFVGFDVVIGNPPYIFSRELMTEKEKEFFYNNYSLTQFKLNTYVLFTELSNNIICKKGLISLIIPNNWLTLQNNSQFREFVLSTFKNIVIVNDKNKTFEDANVDASILQLSNFGIETFKAFELIEKSFSLISEVTPKSYLSNKGSIINYNLNTNPFVGSIIGKINSQSSELKTLFNVKNGVQAYTVGEGLPKQTEEMKNQRVYHSRTKIDEDWKMYCDGSDIIRYGFKWSGYWIKYGKNLSRRRIPELFEGERIFVRQIPANMPNAIVSSFINLDVVCDNNYMIVKSLKASHISLKCLAGFLNSKLTSFWFFVTFAKHQRKLFPQFKVKELEIFPIPIADNIQISEKIEILVDQILTKKSQDNSADTTDLENQIDQLIYQLYELTEEEIKIVEGI
jgi:adenine-specific DNA-methyltransferase